jgi:NAD(P)-dependent dehydrogenase (short-subunit alcohol dehydrogenase family)
MSMTRSTSKGVALVTGAANGIGKGIALRLAADGFDVPVNDVESNLAELEALARELRSVGRRTATVVADVSNGPFAFTHSRRHYRFESARRLPYFVLLREAT